MSKSCVCDICKEKAEQHIRENNKCRKYTKDKGELSNCFPVLGLFYIDGEGRESYIRHGFKNNYCSVCGAEL